MKTRAVEFDDIQTLARFGCGHLKDSIFLLLTIKDKQCASDWLQNTKFLSALPGKQLPDAATQIAFTAQGLQRMGLNHETLSQFSDEFLQGMGQNANRSRRLGDIGNSAPSNWQWGYNDQPDLHVLLLLYSRKASMDTHRETVLNQTFDKAFGILHTLPTETLSAKEPFGFIDGISQPKIDWEQNQSTDTHERDEYSNLLAPGEIVLGYNNEYGQITNRPLIDPADDPNSSLLPTAPENPALHDFGGNGAYLVVRQLEQHVDRFWQFMQAQSSDSVNSDTTGADRSKAAEQLAAEMVGRHLDGTPLVKSTGRNQFTFDEDPDGLQCPISSHIRRSNPRSGDFPPGVKGWFDRLVKAMGFKRQSEYEDLVASSRFHRILRRGRTYGSKQSSSATQNNTQAQGLQFVCLTGNILRQFEFVQSAWSVSSSFAGLREQRDPLLGHRQPRLSGTHTDSFMRPTKHGVQEKTTSLPDFVTVLGGAYFFLPGISAINYLAHTAKKQDAST